MAQQEDVAVAREAVRALERAVQAVSRHYGDTVDVRRLQHDVGRLGDDLTLLCGAEAAKVEAPALMIIEDRDYEHSFWMDAEDEGLGRSDFRAR